MRTGSSQSHRLLMTFVVGSGLLLGSLGIYVVPFQVGALMDGLGLSATRSGWLGTLEVGAMSLTAILLAPWLAPCALWGAALAVAGGHR